MDLSLLKLHSSLDQNLRLIALARLVMLLVAQFFVVLNQLVFAIEINLFWAEFWLTLLALSSIWTLFQLRSVPNQLERSVKLQLLSDVVLLTLLFHVTGGAANPFVSILLFPLVVSASLLGGKFNWFMVIFTLSCYASLFLEGMQESTSMSGHEHHHMPANDQAFSLHIIGMWFNFAISAILISFFVVRMRQAIEQQQALLNKEREQGLRDEQLLGIATQAASAAHHLGTPLSTMSVIVNDLQNETTFPEEFKPDLALIASQVANCKQVLTNLRQDAEQKVKPESVTVFVSKLLDEFRLIRPGVFLETLSLKDLPDGLTITADPALRMAILNILNNAADVSPEEIKFEARYENGHLIMNITDFGSGFSKTNFDTVQTSSKQDGLGMGLFLSHATVNRYGGEIQLFQQAESGTRVRIDLPLHNPKKLTEVNGAKLSL